MNGCYKYNTRYYHKAMSNSGKLIDYLKKRVVENQNDKLATHLLNITIFQNL